MEAVVADVRLTASMGGADNRMHTGVVFLAPGKIEPDKVHEVTVPDPRPTRRR